MLNRLDGKPFDDADQRLFEVRGIQFCSNNILFQQDLIFLGNAASATLGRGEEYVVCICGLTLILRTPHLIRLHPN